MTKEKKTKTGEQNDVRNPSLGVLALIAAVLLFLFSIDLLSTSFQLISKDAAYNIFYATANPFVSLFIGLLVTALIQSSSTTTSMVVAAVASGSMSLESAVPMIMGANIGTTLTSSLVSLGFITKRRAFRKAVSAGVIQDFYNIILAAILFPLELSYGFLAKLATEITTLLNPIFGRLLPEKVTHTILLEKNSWIGELIPNPYILLAIAFILLFVSIKLIANLASKMLIGQSKGRLQKYVFFGPWKAFGFGTLITAIVQSSSVTTSLMVPLVATGKVGLKRAFPFIVGANLGTTITALIAAIFISKVAITVAVVHFLFNFIGAFLMMVIPSFRNIPIELAKIFARVTNKHRILGLIYLIITFFLVPFVLIYLGR